MSRLRLLDKLLYEKSLKEGSKITQVQASRDMKVSNSFLHQVLTGLTKGSKNVEDYERIAQYFGMTSSELSEQIERDKRGL